MDERELIVIGGGISGLSLAWYAAQSGRAPLVLEASERVGGCLDSRRVGDRFWFELGAHTLYNSYGALLEVTEGCATPPTLVPRGESRKRFGFLRNGGITTMGPLSVFKQFRWWELALHAPRAPFGSKRGKTTAEHFSRVVGPRNYREVLAPFLSAVPSQAVDEFPAEGPGSLFKKRERRQDVIKSFTFDGGVSAVADAIAASGVEVVTSARATSVARATTGYKVSLGDGRELGAKRIAIAVDPATASRLTGDIDSELAAALSGVQTVAVESVGVVVRKDALQLPDMAFLVPANDIFWSAVTRDPVPDDDYRAFSFHFRPGTAPDAQRQRIAEVLGVDASAFEHIIERRTVLPAPQRDHADTVRAIDARLTDTTFAVTGNYFAGLSIEDCVARSKTEWARLAGALVPAT